MSNTALIKKNLPGDLVVCWGFIHEDLSLLTLCQRMILQNENKSGLEKYHNILEASSVSGAEGQTFVSLLQTISTEP